MPIPWFDKPESWTGFDHSGEPDRTVRFDEDHPLLARLLKHVQADPVPSHEERVERCELMGMVFCNCRLKDGHVVVYNPACPVHNLLAKLSR